MAFVATPERAQLVAKVIIGPPARPKNNYGRGAAGNENIKAVVSLPPATLFAVLMWRTNCVAV